MHPTEPRMENKYGKQIAKFQKSRSVQEKRNPYFL